MNMPTWFKPYFERLSSMSLAIALLVVLALASMIGTILKQNQMQADYLTQFGPLWYSEFRVLGLFDMYHTGWFKGLLAFLMLSLLVCLWRHTPRMIREMRTRKVIIADKSLQQFHHLHHWTLNNTNPALALAAIKSGLRGWEQKTAEDDGKTYVRSDKGRWSKWGYILVHSAILVILVGGWIGAHYGFRGTMNVVEGGEDDTISFVQGTGAGHLRMPFYIRCDNFFIDFYPTGMPKAFRSTLSIIDHGKVVVDHKSIIVNEPLIYKGVHIFQASFGDGGSGIGLKLFRLDTGKVETIQTKVYDTWRDPKTGVSLELTNFSQYNIQNMSDPGKPKHYKNLGPSVEFILRGPGLKSVKIKSFMNPFIMNGHDRGNLMMVSMSGRKRDYKPFSPGLDFSNKTDWKLYKNFVEALQKQKNSKSKKANFMAFKSALDRVFGKNLPANFQQTGARMMQAMNNLTRVPWPFIPVLYDYHQVYYTGLELAQDPGMNIVWLGSAMLVIGLCLMFYMPHRKLWLVLKSEGGNTEVTMGGMTNRNKLGFEKEFHELLIRMEESFASVPPTRREI